MNFIEPLILGTLAGFGVAAPFGPVAMLVTQRTLTQGKSSGCAAGLGAALAQTLYAAIAVLGFSTLSTTITNLEAELNQIGLRLLIIFAILIATSKPTQNTRSQRKSKNLFNSFLSASTLTLASPATLIVFLSLLAGSNLHLLTALSTTLFIIFTFLTALLWWLLLSILLNLAHQKLTPNWWTHINRLTALIFIVFAIISLT